MKMMTRFAALLIITTIAATFVPSASAYTLARPCGGVVGLAECAVDEGYCIAWYAAFGEEGPGCSSATLKNVSVSGGAKVEATTN